MRKSAEEGSPPRVRGKDIYYKPISKDSGITPACAGKSPCQRPVNHSRKDHPRVCGEKFLFSESGILPEGSPPRVRGKDPRPLRPVSGAGITPACAGKSPAVLHPV